MLKINTLIVLLALALAANAQELPENPGLKALMIKLDQAHANAVLKADFAALDSLTHADLTVNSPRGAIVNGKKELFDLIKNGIVKYKTFVRTPERFLFYKDMVIVMGNETVVPAGTAPHAGETVKRRYTDIWMMHDGRWQLQVRHANIVCE